jgi:glycosyltransferase involved in cell wall biosynthesis
MRRSRLEFRYGYNPANREAEEASAPGIGPYTLVSIVIPTKNSANTLGDTPQSINNRTYRNYEIIVVDNHLKDETLTIATKYTNKIHFMGPERTAQVNFGINNAEGKYVYRMDPDWILEPTVLEQTVKKFEDEEFDAILVHNSDDPRTIFWGRVKKLYIQH